MTTMNAIELQSLSSIGPVCTLVAGQTSLEHQTMKQQCYRNIANNLIASVHSGFIAWYKSCALHYKDMLFMMTKAHVFPFIK